MGENGKGVGVEGSGVDKDGQCEVGPSNGGDPHGLLHSIVNEFDGVDGGLKFMVQVDGGVQGSAFLPQPHQVVVADVLHIRTLTCVPLRLLLVAIVVTVRKQVETPQTVRSPTFGQGQGQIHEGQPTPLKTFLSLLLHFAFWPVGMLSANLILGLVAVDNLCAPVPDPLGPPVLPVNNTKAFEVFDRDELINVSAGLAQMLGEALVLWQPPIHRSARTGVVRVMSQVAVVENGDIGSTKGLVEVGNNVKNAEIQIDLEPQPTGLGGSIPYHHKRSVRDQRCPCRLLLLGLNLGRADPQTHYQEAELSQHHDPWFFM